MARTGIFLAPSTAPSRRNPGPQKTPTNPSASRPVRSQVVRVPIGADVNRLPTLREITPQGKRALAIRAKYPQIIERLENRDNPTRKRIPRNPIKLLGGLTQNLASEAMQSVSGTSRLLAQYSADIARLALSPTGLTSGRAAANRLAETTKGMYVGLKDDAVFTFGPLARGNLKEFAGRAYNEPLRVGGTLALAYSGGGQAAGAGLRAVGKRTGSVRVQRAGSKATIARPGEAAPRRERAPQRISPEIDSMGRRPIPGSPEVVKQSRARSSNLITREIQRNITDPAFGALRGAIGRAEITGRGGRRLNPMSNSARYERLLARDVRNRESSFLERSDHSLLSLTNPFQHLVRRVGAETKGMKGAVGGKAARGEQAFYAAALRAQGLNNLSSTVRSRTAGRDGMIAMWRESLAKQKNPEYAKMTEKNIEAFSKIPDEWLAPATAPKYINDLTKEMEGILAASTKLKVDAGVISPATVERSGARSQEAAFGVYEQGATMREALQTRTTAARSAVVQEGKVKGFDAEITALQVRINTPDSKADVTALSKDLKDVRRKRSEANKSMLASRRTEKKSAAEYDKNRKAVDDVLGDMAPGQYMPDYRQGQKKIRLRMGGRPIGAGAPAMTARAERINRGVIFREGTGAFGPEVTMRAVRDAIDINGRIEAVSKIMEQYVVRGPDGNPMPVTDDMAVNIARNSSSMYVVKTKRSLVQMLRLDAKRKESALEDSGSPVDPGDMDSQLLSDLETTLGEGGNTRYLIPRAAVKGWNDAIAARQNVLDDLNSYWKAGVLALSPRWYLQNGVGMGLQFLLGAGTDIRAIGMASKSKYRDSVLAEIAATGLVQDLGKVAKGISGTTRNPIKRAVAAGYRLNFRMEAYFRRAMYFHSLKKGLVDNKVSKMGDGTAEMAAAWDDVAKSAEKGEVWATKMIDEVINETDRFMGNYTRYNKLERVVMRRAFPFYGWMRAVNRLAFTLPVKYPKRAALLASASRSMYEMYSDEESLLMEPISGFVSGSKYIGTSIMNPIETLKQTVQFGADVGSTLKEEGIGGLWKAPAQAIQSTWSNITPVFTKPVEVATGFTTLKIPVRFSPGYDDAYRDPRTGNILGTNPATGSVANQTPRAGIDQIIGSTVPLWNFTRRMLAGSKAPYTDASLKDLAVWRAKGWLKGNRSGDPSEAARLMEPPRQGGSKLTRTWYGDISGSIIGVPIYDYSPKHAKIDQARLQQNFLDAYLSDRKKIKKSEALFKRGSR